MAALNLRRISNPSNLKRIDPQCFTQLLDPYREYFAGRGVVLPALGDDLPRFDWDKLVEAFLTPDVHMPLELVETLHLVDELASPAAMDALLTAAREQGVDLAGSRSDTPLDIAVLAFLRDRAFAECVHQEHATQKKSDYVYFGSAEPLPEPQPLTGDRLEQLRAELDDYYAAHRRGRHCRIFVSERGSRTWVTVRHGDAIKRETDLEKGGVIFVYRPEVFSVVFYDAATEEIGVCAPSDRERNLYRMLMGKYLLGFEETFVDGSKFTLAPLLEAGRSSLSICWWTGSVTMAPKAR